MKNVISIFLFCLAFLAVEQAESKWSGSRGFAGYGNWCGKGGKGKPIDEADQICYEHDMCGRQNKKLTTKDYAYINPCFCDRKFLKDMRKVLPKLRKRYKNKARFLKAKRHVKFMIQYFKLRKCVKSKLYQCETRKRITIKKKCTKKLGKKICRKVPHIEPYKWCGDKFKYGVGGK